MNIIITTKRYILSTQASSNLASTAHYCKAPLILGSVLCERRLARLTGLCDNCSDAFRFGLPGKASPLMILATRFMAALTSCALTSGSVHGDLYSCFLVTGTFGFAVPNTEPNAFAALSR